MSKDLRPSKKTVLTKEFAADADMKEALYEAYQEVAKDETYSDITIVSKRDIDLAAEKENFRIIVKARNMNEPRKEPSEAEKLRREEAKARAEQKKKAKEEAKAKKAAEREAKKKAREEAKAKKAAAKASKEESSETSESESSESKKKTPKKSPKTEVPVEA